MTKEKSIDIATQAGIVERGMEAYKAAKERGWVGLSDERLMEMPKQEQDEPDWYHAECDNPDYSGFFKSKADAETQVNEHGGYVTEFYTKPQSKQKHDEPDYKALWLKMCIRYDELEKGKLLGYEDFKNWMVKEMPQMTIIGNPEWWAMRIYDKFIYTKPQTKQEDTKINRFRIALKKANAQAEHFEREWYLLSDELEKLKQQRKPLTNDEFLQLLLRKGSTDIVAYTTFVGGSIQMQGKIGLLKSAKVIKEFIEECYGIKE